MYFPMIGWSAWQLLGKAPAALQVQPVAGCQHMVGQVALSW